MEPENRDSQITLTDERTPLLSSPPKSSKTSAPSTSLGANKWQIIILSFSRFAEGVTLTTTLPFVNHMVEDLRITRDPEKVGYYVGLIESSFALAQFLTVFQWGRLSDLYGRKPIILMSLLVVSFASISFGLSKSYSAMIFSRVAAGALNGLIGCVKSMIGELTDEHNQARAFAILMVCWSSGAIIGPLIGGYLSQPTTRYPNFFGHGNPFHDFLRQYPYALPTTVAALLPLFAFFVILFFGQETYKMKLSHKKHVPPSDEEGEEEDIDEEEEEGRGRSNSPSRKFKHAMRALMTRQIALLLLNYFVLAFQVICLQSLLTLFCYTPVLIGGLGFTVSDIGKALSFLGFCSMLNQFFIFPKLQRALGTLRLYRSAMLVYPIVFALFPVCNAVARAHYTPPPPENNEYKRYVWPTLGTLLGLRVFADLVWASLLIMVNDASPSRSLLGSLNGVTQSAASLGRGLGPMSATSLFALSIDYNLLGGKLIWYAMICWTGVGVASSWLLQEIKPKWREGTKERRDEVLVAEAGALEEEEAVF
ncbi:MFS general substrate transporter [Atractiella rhizophila]|nr:MFS general substrate transporter [Atractiella rhizophila]